MAQAPRLQPQEADSLLRAAQEARESVAEMGGLQLFKQARAALAARLAAAEAARSSLRGGSRSIWAPAAVSATVSRRLSLGSARVSTRPCRTSRSTTPLIVAASIAVARPR